MDISRRAILGIGAALPVAAIPTSHAAPAASGPSAADWADLHASLRGSLALPGSADYRSRARLFDPRWDFRRPAAVARVLLTQDVARCVEFARDHGLKVTGRSGGHSYTGASATTGTLVIDTRSMRGVSLTSGRTQATVAAGAQLYAVHTALAAKGRSIPTGTCPTVGTAGLSLVGGLGVDSRRVGLTSDRLVRATVVDGQGRIHYADTDSDPELFWSLRGGGPGVGIVTSWTYRTVGAPRRGFFSLTFPSSKAASVVRGWGSWITQQPGDTWANAHVDSSGGSLSVRLFGVCPAGREEARAASLRRAIGISPTRTSTTTRSYLDGVDYLGGGSTTARTRIVAGSDILALVTSGAAEAIEEAMRSVPQGVAASAILDPLDGAVSDVAKGDTAFPWRDEAATIQWYVGMPKSPTSDQYATAQAWVAKAHDLLGSRSRGGYLGYVESGRPLQEYLGGNTDRVTAVRRTYDPQGVVL